MEYDISYRYDQLGNRVSKREAGPKFTTLYHYDTDLDPNDPNSFPDPDYVTRNNRLLSYDVYVQDPNHPSDPNYLLALRKVSYVYYQTGDASNITVKDWYVDPNLTPGDPNDYAWYNDLALYYTKGGALHMVITDRWKLSDPNDPASFDAYEKLSAREFAYDNPQARWLDREVSTSTYAPGSGAQHWTDSLGVAPYLDFECTPPVDPNDPNELPVVSGVTRYLAASAQQKLDGEGEPLETRYYHGDLIDSTCLTTDEAGTPNSGGGVVSTVCYTAFGEVISYNGAAALSPPGGGFPRYQFAGATGYEVISVSLVGTNQLLSVSDIQHLGARWYDDAVGRFVQRDPVGLIGGINTYAYLDNNPLADLDPNGTTSEYPDHPPRIKQIERIIEKLMRKIASERPGYRLFWRKLLSAAYKERNALFMEYYGPLVFMYACVRFHYDVLEPAIDAAKPLVNDWLDRSSSGIWNKRLRNAGFGPSGRPGDL